MIFWNVFDFISIRQDIFLHVTLRQLFLKRGILKLRKLQEEEKKATRHEGTISFRLSLTQVPCYPIICARISWFRMVVVWNGSGSSRSSEIKSEIKIVMLII